MEFRKSPFSEYCPGAYSLDLYCDHINPDHSYNEFPHGIVGHNARDCRRQAKAAGWVIHRDMTATCPKCIARLKPPPQ